jgi:hypothetical protein
VFLGCSDDNDCADAIGDGMTRAAARERIDVMRRFVNGMNTAEIGRAIRLAESEVERLIHTRTCLDMKREIAMLKMIAEKVA